jgi:hypothetical protein
LWQQVALSIIATFNSPVSAQIIEGTLFTLTHEELEQADEYGPDGYERVLAVLKSGTGAWVYLKVFPDNALNNHGGEIKHGNVQTE